MQRNSDILYKYGDTKIMISIENFLPKSYQIDLYELTKTDEFPWYWNSTISGMNPLRYSGISSTQYGFSHVLYDKPTGRYENSPYQKFFRPMVYFIEEKFNVKVNELLRIRLGLNTKVDPTENILHVPHTDYFVPHKTVLYYVNDSDGDTFLYNEFYNPESKVEPKEFTLNQRSTPQMGKAIFFDGLQYHSSSSPCKNLSRIAVNINFV